MVAGQNNVLRVGCAGFVVAVSHALEVAMSAKGKQVLPRWRLRDEFFCSVRSRELTQAHKLLERDYSAFCGRHVEKIATYGPKKLASVLLEFSELFAREEYLDSYYELLVQENRRNERKVAPGRKKLEKIKGLRETVEKALTGISRDRLADLLASRHLKPYRVWLRFMRAAKHDEFRSPAQKRYQRMMDHLSRKPVPGGRRLSSVVSDIDSIDDDLRRAAHEKHTEILGKTSQRAAAYYNQIMVDMMVRDKKCGYKRADKAFCIENDVSPQLLDRMVSSLRAGRGLAHRYFSWRASQQGSDRIVPSDLLVDETLALSWNKARKTVLGAYKRFSTEFRDCAQRFFDNGWIDAQKRAYKDRGTFCQSVNVHTHAFISMYGFDGGLSDTFDLAHEVGHGVHDFLSSRQTQLNWDPSVAFKELASQFTELLVCDEILRTHKDAETRKQTLLHVVNHITNQLFVNTAEISFERDVHALRRNARRNLSAEKISDLWVSNNEKFYGPSIDFKQMDRYGWVESGFLFETPFYLYSYTFGEALVLALYDMYRDAPNKKEFVAKYMDLLRAGGSEPMDVALKRFGLDPNGKEIWQRAFEVYEDLLNSLERLDSAPALKAKTARLLPKRA